MPDKPITAAGYAPGQRLLVQATCLYVATKLGDLMQELVVVGGLVPSLIVDQAALPPGAEPHVGTMDLDLGLAIAVLDGHRYQELADRLRRSGFAPDVNASGNPTRQRWRIGEPIPVTVDFLIAPSSPDDRAGHLRNMEADFAAIITPGLPLAFRDRLHVPLNGTTLLGEQASRNVWVCGPAAFLVLKALAFENRGENKDAYDLFYVLRNYGTGPEAIARAFIPLREAPESRKALEILRRDFTSHDGVGARRVAAFLTGDRDDVIQADVVGVVEALLSSIYGPTT